ncbi:hemiasterlin resistant protein 1-like [Anopheles moucheti]|uniref:hemiasterlin resistant protein 1-like n=1 Tax=Anopheles moucheti TaxID=186751 RepID=UPI0022EFE8CC|nr:hemiasterlin resistant protein 1-like [Anopheles moucheti]
MPRRDTRSKTVPPSRKSTTTDTKSQHGTGQSVPTKAAAEPTKSPTAPTVATPAPGSGFFSQMAATAGGVAIGSVLGRALGGLFERSEPKAVSTDAVEKEQQSAMELTKPDKSASVEPCGMEIKQFLSCVDKEMDVKICEGFKEAMQQCTTKANFRIPMFDHV